MLFEFFMLVVLLVVVLAWAGLRVYHMIDKYRQRKLAFRSASAPY
jgi:hypothetical protein